MNSCFVNYFSIKWNFDLYTNLGFFSFYLLQMRDSYLILDEYVSLFFDTCYLYANICMYTTAITS